MKRFIFLVIALLLSSQANATIISFTGSTSSQGVPASIIAAPASVQDAMVTNQAQQGFDEQQNVTLGAGLGFDFGGIIAAGTTVDSHMIFLNISAGSSITSHSVIWTFSGMVLGVMSDSAGTLEAASTPILGALGTVYGAPFGGRGMEGGDGYSFTGNTLSVTMVVSQPGDWIRVITATVVPEPTTLALFGIGLAGIGFARRKNKS